MNMIATHGPTMTSREIADLVESRHDNVKRTILRLFERGTIAIPPTEEYLDELGRKALHFRIGKRDSYVIVAQLSPEFTARLVDRWQELEAAAAPDPMAMLNDPATMRTLLLGYAEKVLALQTENERLTPLAAALHRIAGTDGTVTLTDAAKSLQVPPRKLTALMSSRKWMYKRPGSDHWVAYQNVIQMGLLCHKVTTVQFDDAGHEKMRMQVRVTAKGMARLGKVIESLGAAA